jgi:hypothetical protein
MVPGPGVLTSINLPYNKDHNRSNLQETVGTWYRNIANITEGGRSQRMPMKIQS